MNTSIVCRELLLMDAARFIEPESLINKVVYDIEDLLPLNTSTTSLSSENKDSTISLDNMQSKIGPEVEPFRDIHRPCDCTNCSYQPLITVDLNKFLHNLANSESTELVATDIPSPSSKVISEPESTALIFNSTSESCNLRKAIQVSYYI